MVKKYFIVVTFLLVSCSSYEYAHHHEWHGAFDPTENAAQVYGGYSAGCVDGAVALPDSGAGFTSMNRLGNRYYGHPDLINFIKKLGKTVENKYKRQLLISDLGHARGGPADINSSAHRSHQSGLDVDIWFRHMPSYVKVKQDTYPTSTLKSDKSSISLAGFNSKTAKILKDAASFDEVERILLNPLIKKEMCERYKGASWLNKLRPWWGHHKHFHVRLKCPDGNSYCKKQSPVPESDGCGAQLDWWFSDEAKDFGKEKSDEKRKYPKLPRQCDAVWKSR